MLDQTRTRVARELTSERLHESFINFHLETLQLFIEFTCSLPEGEDEDYKKEALNQSIARLSSQMTRLSSIVVDTLDENISGKFSSFPIEVSELAQNSDDSIRENPEGTTKDPDFTKNPAGDPENIPTDPELEATGVDSTTKGVEKTDHDDGTTTDADDPMNADDTATDADKTLSVSEDSASRVGSCTMLAEDMTIDPESSPKTRRKMSSKMKSFFKRKKKKRSRYMESSV